jgi:hypothetical protein
MHYGIQRLTGRPDGFSFDPSQILTNPDISGVSTGGDGGTRPHIRIR